MTLLSLALVLLGVFFIIRGAVVIGIVLLVLGLALMS